MITLYTFIFIIASTLSTDLDKFISTNEKSSDNTVSQIIKQYSEFRLIVHIDNTTKDIVKDIATDCPLIIFNHDVPNAALNYTSREKHLHVASFTHTKLLKSKNYIATSDIIIFLMDTKSLKEFSRQFVKIPNGGVFVVTKHPHVTKIFSACFYCGKFSG